MLTTDNTQIMPDGSSKHTQEPKQPIKSTEIEYSDIRSGNPGEMKVIKRNGKMVPFDSSKIANAIIKAFLDEENIGYAPASSRIRDITNDITRVITATFERRIPTGGSIGIEEIQDQVELELMRGAHHKVARSYVLYREQRRQLREQNQENESAAGADASVQQIVTADNGQKMPLDIKQLREALTEACAGLRYTDVDLILDKVLANLYEGIPLAEVHDTLVITARSLVEEESNYSYVAARLLLEKLQREVLNFFGIDSNRNQRKQMYARLLSNYIVRGVEMKLLSPQLTELFDLKQLGEAIIPERDMQFTYLGMQTLYDRYFIHSNKTRLELPQTFFMRVAMGLSLREDDPTARALEFYQLLSSFDYMCSTPTLFNSGTLRPQLSSCFLTTVSDDLEGIFGSVRDNAVLSKWAGGLGNDWTNIRGQDSHIKGTNGISQGVVPFLKVANDTTIAVNQGGKRKGALCCYLETWHIDIEQFLELRKNTGDDRRRTHDMHTANWVPDLFMKRLAADGDWTLFSPDEVPGLHDAWGNRFESLYCEYEKKAERGEIKLSKKIKAGALWRKMISMLFETGHPWITFKDPCNIRSPQQHLGVVHSSNLCTEITLNTSSDEIAVCNLGSINLANFIENDKLDDERLHSTLKTAVRMLDNVVDINYYAVPAAKKSNLKHRPVGLGQMGFQDALYKMHIPYQSQQAIEFADHIMERISYYAIESSSNLAAERGNYPGYQGSLWDRGILPIDSIELLRSERGEQYMKMNSDQTMDWDSLRSKVQKQGMRNSNVMAIAPTATISNITGVSQSIEPAYSNMYVKSNMSGEFTVINPYLLHDLKALDLWDQVMVNDIKYYNGNLHDISRVPERIKELYATAFEIDPEFIIEAASRRQKWIDQSQSLNIYISHTDGSKISDLYKQAWLKGLKTTYYMRSLGATQSEKSTAGRSELNAVSPDGSNAGNDNSPAPVMGAAACSIDDPDCESCQ